MKKVRLQRNTLTLFFWAFLTYFFNFLSNFLTFAKDMVMVNQGMQLTIDFSYESAGLATVLFIGQFIFDYLYIAFSWIVSFFAIAFCMQWIIAIVQEKKINLLVIGIVISLLAILLVYVSPLFFISVFGIIILYYPTVFDTKSVFDYASLKNWWNDFIQLFDLNTSKTDFVKVTDYLKNQPNSAYQGDMVKTIALNALVYIGSLVSFGLLSGILLYWRDNYEFNHSNISGFAVQFSSKWYTWFFKGIKWALLTWLTFGLYWLSGACKLDYYQLRSTSIHFDNDQADSFFDGVFSQYIFYRVLALVLCVFTFGLAYPIVSRYLSIYLTQHTIISGHRLMCQYSIQNDFNNFKYTYPIFIVTLGLSSIIFHYIYLCYFRENVHIDINPRLYGEDEAFIVSHDAIEVTTNDVNKVSEATIEDKVDEVKVEPTKISQTPKSRKTSSSATKKDGDVKKTVAKKSTAKKPATKAVKTVDREGKRILKRVSRNVSEPKAIDSAIKKTTVVKDEHKIASKEVAKKLTVKKSTNQKNTNAKQNAKTISKQSKSKRMQTSQDKLATGNVDIAVTRTKYQIPVASRKVARQLKKKR